MAFPYNEDETNQALGRMGSGMRLGAQPAYTPAFQQSSTYAAEPTPAPAAPAAPAASAAPAPEPARASEPITPTATVAPSDSDISKAVAKTSSSSSSDEDYGLDDITASAADIATRTSDDGEGGLFKTLGGLVQGVAGLYTGNYAMAAKGAKNAKEGFSGN
jgi:hypothetical protein